MAALPTATQQSDLTLQEHSEAFEEVTGVVVSSSTLSRAIVRLPGGPWPIKKSHR